MVSNIVDFTSRLTDNQFSRAARQSAGRIIRVSREAFEAGQLEGRRVFTTVRKEGEKLQKFAKVPKMPRMPKMHLVEDMQEAAAERISEFEKVFQKRVDRVLKDLGIPTAKEVAALSRRVQELADKVEAGTKRARKAPVRGRPATKAGKTVRAARAVAAQAEAA